LHTHKLEINRAIAEIENFYTSDTLISCYKDFLKHRDYLHFYQYNEAVFVSLIDLIHKIWNTNKRVSRVSLIAVTKRYVKKAETKANLTIQTSTKIFELFKEIVYHENLNLSKESVEITKRAINSIMIGIVLKEKQLQWLCDHSKDSGFILNRILRYQQKSNLISNWAKKNFEKDFVRSRRSDITSWIIDENPDFKIEKETLEYDFEYQIIEDKRLVKEYKNDIDAYRAIEKELLPILNSDIDPFFDNDIYTIKIQDKPVLNCPWRHYSTYINMNSEYDTKFPDFKHTYKDFYDKFDYYYNRIMAWSIAYSRLNINKKIMLLSKYYSDSTYTTFYAIGKRLKSVEYFNWLKQIA